MLEVSNFEADDLNTLALSANQAFMGEHIDGDYGQRLKTGSTLSVSIKEDGRLLACFGLVPIWAHSSEAWMLASEQVSRGTRTLVKTLKSLLQSRPELRIQTTVKADFETGLRFVEFLGFELEGRLQRYNVQGQDVYMYARVKHG
jgi:RimJ/RimL family protein N-acetyltransferase